MAQIRVPPSGPYVDLPVPPPGVLAALPQLKWIDKASTATGGAAARLDAVGAYPSLAAAFAAVGPGPALVNWAVVCDDYSAEPAIDFLAAGIDPVCIQGFGGGIPPAGGAIAYAFLPGITAGFIALDHVLVNGPFNAAATLSRFCAFQGAVVSAFGGSNLAPAYTQCSFNPQAPTTLDLRGNFLELCTFAETNALIDGCQWDEFTLESAGVSGVHSLDAGGPFVTQGGALQRVAYLQDADRAVSIMGDLCSRAVLPANTLTAPRAITVDLVGAAATATFIVDRYDSTANALTVNGLAVLPRTRTTFINSGGPGLVAFSEAFITTL